MFGLPRHATALWLAVVASGFAALGVSLVADASSLKFAPAALLFALAGAIAEKFKVTLPTTGLGNSAFFTLSAAVLVAAALVLPVSWAITIVVLAVAVGNGTVWFKRLYNISQYALSVAAAGLVWHTAHGSATLVEMGAVPAVILAVIVHFAVNTVLTCAIVAGASGLPLRTTYWRLNRTTWPASMSMTFIGVLIAVLWVTSPWTIAVAAIPLTGIYYALRNGVSLETQTVDALFNLADILDARDPYTHGHSLRVGQYAERLALRIGLSGDDAHLVFLAGRLHDIGKCAIKNEVLLKPGPLDQEEFEHMCIHPEVGGSMLASFSLFRECSRFVRGHHERWDGKGYPDKLAGEDIPLGARIIAVADAFDAMTTTRPYRKALPLTEAKRRLQDGAGSQWDARIIDAFLHLLETTSVGQAEPTPLGQPEQPPIEQPEPISLSTHAEEHSKAA